jgi:hypothetical protein
MYMPTWLSERCWCPVHVMSWPSKERLNPVEAQLPGCRDLADVSLLSYGAENRRRHGARGVPSLLVLPGRARWDASLVPRSLS